MAYTIELSDELGEKLQRRAVLDGYGDPQAYVAALIERDLSEDELDLMDGPPHLSPADDAELERMLIQRSDEGGESIEVTADFLPRLLEEYERHRAARERA